MRFIVVPHTGHLPLATFMPVLLTSTVPSKSRFSLHFTQYPLYVVLACVATVSSSVDLLPSGECARSVSESSPDTPAGAA